MKKIFAILLALMLFTMPLVAFAEGEEEAPVVTEGVEGDNSTTETETPTESENSAPEEEGEPNFEEVQKTISQKLVDWIMPHIEEISVIITLFGTLIYNIRRNSLLDKSVIKLNNNAVSISENTSDAITKALTNMEGVSGVVTGYQTEMALLLEAYRNTAEDRKRLENELCEIHKYLKLSKDANVEFANELAELLNLANIPNFKKEEIGARHLAAVNAIAEAEAKTETEEVKEDVGEET